MIKKIVIVIACIFAIASNAQDGTGSPYSYFGLGELSSSSSIENQMMGGIGMYADSIHINLQNPAAYGNLRLTAYTAGISYKQLTLKSATAEEDNSLTTLDYLSLGFPVGKGFGVGLGLQPYSAVGYNLLANSINGNNAEVTNQYSGTGGINRVYLSIGYQITKNLSIGVTANYNFGEIENLRTQIVEGVQFGTLDNRISRIGGIDFNYALNYTPKITDNLTLYSNVRINTQANLSARNTQEVGSFSLSSGEDIEVFNVNLAARGLEKQGLTIPTKTTLGIGIGEERKWFIGGEYSFQKLSSFSNDFVVVDTFDYQDASSFALGGFYIPDYTSFTSFFKRVTYRAGMRSVKTGMVVNNQEIDDFGITFGVGLPLASGTSGFSNINLGFEIGKRGTTDANLIKENYFKLSVGLSLNDRWFRKRKIN